MQSFDEDTDDVLGRVFRRLRERRDQLIEDMIGGNLDPATYAAYCARIEQIRETIEIARAIRRGEDGRMKPRDPVPSVEE